MIFYVYASAMCPHRFRHHCLRRRRFNRCHCRLPSPLQLLSHHHVSFFVVAAAVAVAFATVAVIAAVAAGD